ncbi:hypothetical protein [Anderseniella sp. Alg231-50]|uniref:hypothetical protein n=1 Tax=Anderseniella sp. Alg231-50 TaxID=1922226 RepID=UPI00307B45B9
MIGKVSFICQACFWAGASYRAAGILVVLVFAPINSAHACACCAETGYRSETVSEVGTLGRHILQSIRFTSRAELDGSADNTLGLIKPSSDEPEGSLVYALESTVEPDILKFKLSREGQERGEISFPLPSVMTRFGVDTRDPADSENRLGPTLYREWRLTGDATLTGLVTKGTQTAQIRLILQGRGNYCVDVLDFTHWSLAVEGKAIRFSLIGELERND